jgi:hypothetical protein
MMHGSWLLVVSASWSKFRDFVANTVEVQFVTVSCEHITTQVRDFVANIADTQLVSVSCEQIMAQGSWLCCKHLLMRSSWLLVVSTSRRKFVTLLQTMLIHSSWLLVVNRSWRTVRDYVANITDAQFVTATCEHTMTHSSWLCCKHLLMHSSWLCCKHLLMHSSWLLLVSTLWRTVRDYVANIADAQFVTVTREHIVTHSSWLCCKHTLMHSSWLLVVNRS